MVRTNPEGWTYEHIYTKVPLLRLGLAHHKRDPQKTSPIINHKAFDIVCYPLSKETCVLTNSRKKGFENNCR